MNERIRSLFLEAVQLPVGKRSEFLSNSGAAPDVVEQVNNLLKHASPATVLNVHGQRPSTRFASLAGLWPYLKLLQPLTSSPVRRWMLRLVPLLLLLWGGYWLRHEFRLRLEGQAVSALQALDNSIAFAFQSQLAEWSSSVEAVVSEQLGRAAALEAIDDPRPATLARFHQYASNLVASNRFSGYYLANAEGVAYSRTGQATPATPATPYGLQMFARAWQSGKLVVGFPGTQRASTGSRGQGELIPMVTFYVPLFEGGKVRGVFAVARSAEALTGVLTRARAFATGESYAFSPEGLMLTPSRFSRDLERWGLAKKTADPESQPMTWLRDPGRALATAPPEPKELPEVWPRTLLVRTVTSARARGDPKEFSGTITTPYRDYRGEYVVAAWHWLPGLEVGIGTEVDASEIFATATVVDRAILGLLACLGLAGAWAILSTGWLVRMRGQMEAGNQLGSYSLIEKIGEGGMGEVYLARHALLRRTAALKLLRRDRSDDASFAQFENEARVVSRLRHPNTVEIYDFGRAKNGTFYYVMQYLPGLDLADWIKRTGPMPVERTIHIIRQVCSALSEAHSEHLLHCDVKPSNVMLCSTEGIHDFAKLLDFGLAFSLRDAKKSTAQAASGTPYFTAPERLQGDVPIDERTDIYSLAVVWFFLLTARLPHGAGMHWVEATLTTDSAPVGSFVPTDPEVAELIAQCLARDPAQRPASTRELLDRLHVLERRLPWTEEAARAAWAALRI